MGSGGSKQTSDSSRHVFSAETPVRFSQQVLDSLQSSPETDSTRARNLELQIQARVQSELAKIRDLEATRLTDLTASLTPSSVPTDEPSSPDSSSSEQSLTGRIASALTPGSDDSKAERTHDTVKKEIEAMKTKLDGRKMLEKPSGEVERAKEDLVQCLRMNDRRPLDCWKEVEAFKRGVAELERGFVERAMR